jgi:hypothetical protein
MMDWDALYAQHRAKLRGEEASPRPSKFRNVIVRDENGKKLFDSKWEAKRFYALQMEEKFGLIADLRRQVTFSLDLDGIHICNYIADFVYTDRDGQRVVEDAKGFLKPDTKIKLALMKAIHGIEVVLTYAKQ